jgi:hypothetical protein
MFWKTAITTHQQPVLLNGYGFWLARTAKQCCVHGTTISNLDLADSLFDKFRQIGSFLQILSPGFRVIFLSNRETAIVREPTLTQKCILCHRHSAGQHQI